MFPTRSCRAKSLVMGLWIVGAILAGSCSQLPVAVAAAHIPSDAAPDHIISQNQRQHQRFKRMPVSQTRRPRSPWILRVQNNDEDSKDNNNLDDRRIIINEQEHEGEESRSVEYQEGPIASYASSQTWAVRYMIRGGDAAKSNKLLSSVVERTVSAVVMLALLVVWLDSFREKGLILLVMIIQLGLFREGTNAILSDITSDELLSQAQQQTPSASSIQWWWCAAYMLALDGPRILTAKRGSNMPLMTTPTVHLAAFGMMALGMVSFVLALNSSVSFSYEFRVALQELASYHMSALMLIVPSSFWIATTQQFGMKWVLYSCYLVALNDTMAYVFGASFGKHPLLPAISPKKTWEGFLGAFASTMLLSGLFWETFNLGVDYSHALVIAGYASLIAPFGGFLASIVKRAHGKKDFSNMIAGHGGFIDRLDCHLFTAPFVYLYLRYAVGKS